MPRPFDDERTTPTLSHPYGSIVFNNIAVHPELVQMTREAIRDQGAIIIPPTIRSNRMVSHDPESSPSSTPTVSRAGPLILKSSHPRGRLPKSAVPGEGPGTQKDYQCGHCYRWFSCPHNVQQHFNEKHNPDKYHKCGLCAGTFYGSTGKARGEFSRQGTLNRHLRDVHELDVETGRPSKRGKRSRSGSVEEVDSGNDQSRAKSMRLRGQHDVHQSDSGRSSGALTVVSSNQSVHHANDLARRPRAAASVASWASNVTSQTGQSSAHSSATSHPATHAMGCNAGSYSVIVSEGRSNMVPYHSDHSPQPSGVWSPAYSNNPTNYSSYLSNHANDLWDHPNNPSNQSSNTPSNHSDSLSFYSDDLSTQSSGVPTHITNMPTHSSNCSNPTIDPSLINQQPAAPEDYDMDDIRWDDSTSYGKSDTLPDLSQVEDFNRNHDDRDAINNDYIDLAGIGSWAYSA